MFLPKNGLLNWYSYMKFFFWKNSVDFWHWKLTLKVWFWQFLTSRNSATDLKKNLWEWWFLASFLGSTIFKIPQPNWYYCTPPSLFLLKANQAFKMPLICPWVKLLFAAVESCLISTLYNRTVFDLDKPTKQSGEIIS